MSKIGEERGVYIQITSNNTTEQETEMKTKGVATTSKATTDGNGFFLATASRATLAPIFINLSTSPSLQIWEEIRAY
uniref:Uncharacterized protein n=1 Tax=Cucumis melo TaxID=3656 RepID=A0A9I9DMZ7_CUCME